MVVGLCCVYVYVHLMLHLPGCAEVEADLPAHQCLALAQPINEVWNWQGHDQSACLR